ncbi:hypothetical protein EVAR_42773_1 [Eumeta japonica]|uniref:Uncharacterized protein n=1 Tax=Eumeta variegata TaxID=151549 RepID=A0A4C1WL68_EUMVA|nr:hypothetical protein EVAR_42773_1 [Eumeta japonica]
MPSRPIVHAGAANGRRRAVASPRRRPRSAVWLVSLIAISVAWSASVGFLAFAKLTVLVGSKGFTSWEDRKVCDSFLRYGSRQEGMGVSFGEATRTADTDNGMALTAISLLVLIEHVMYQTLVTSGSNTRSNNVFGQELPQFYFNDESRDSERSQSKRCGAIVAYHVNQHDTWTYDAGAGQF